jgi:hypothetical protein
LAPGNRFLTVSADARPAYDSYVIYYGTDPGALDGLIVAEGLPARIPGLDNFTRYYVAVAGVAGGVESDMSAAASDVPGAAGLSPAERALDDWEAVKPAVLNGSAGFDSITGSLKFDGIVGPTYGSAFSFSASANAAGNGVLPSGAVTRPTLPQPDARNIITVSISCEGESVTVMQKTLVPAVSPDEAPYVSGRKTVTATPSQLRAVNLSEEGGVDWVQFKNNSLSGAARKNTASPAIANISVIGSVNGSPGDAPFTFSYSADDVLNGNSPTSRKGIETKGVNTGFSFDLPYRSSKLQTLNVYTSIWGGEAALEFYVNGALAWRDTLSKSTESGLFGQGFEIRYRLPDSAHSASARLIVTRDDSPEWHVSNTLQAITLSESDEAPPVDPGTGGPEPDEGFYIVSGAQPARVSLTGEGGRDWKLFSATSLSGIEMKSGGAGIGALAPLVGVTKMNPNSAAATFEYSGDGTLAASGSHSNGVVFEREGNGLSFTLPYSANEQSMSVYCGAWSALAELTCQVVDGDGNVVKTASMSYDTGAQGPGTAAQYVYFRLNYLLESPGQYVRATLKASKAYDATWGNISVQAITLAAPLLEIFEDPGVEHGRIRVSPNMAAGGTAISVYATPDEGYRLSEGSLKYVLAGGGETPITGGSFAMPGENATVTGAFVRKRDISIDSRVTIEPICLPEPGGDFSPVFEIGAGDKATVNVIVAAYGGGRMLAAASQSLALDGDSARTGVSLAAIAGASYKFFIWDGSFAPLTAITSVDEL